MRIVDAHQDIAYCAVSLGRNYAMSVAETRASEPERTGNIATLGLPDALAGGVGLVCGTLFVMPAGSVITPGEPVYHTPDEAHQLALDQLDIYRRLAETAPLRLVEDRAALDTVIASWGGDAPVQGLIVLMEGADPIRTPDEVSFWYAQGVRIVGPAWGKTRYCGGTGAPGPLTAEGGLLLDAMAAAGMALDVSHMAEESFWQAIERFSGVTIASHSNCRALIPVGRPDRHLSDAMIRALIARDSVIGTVLYNRFLTDDWTYGQGKTVSLDVAVRHIDHICQLAGSTRHVAVGSDFDGGFGSEGVPAEIDTVGDLPHLAEALARAGYTDADIRAVMGENWLRVFSEMLP